MFLFSASRVFFYLYNIDYYLDMAPTHFLFLMLGGLRFDLTAVLYTNLLYILLQILPFKFRHSIVYQKSLLVFYYITNSIIILANSADIAYYQFTLKRTTSSVFQQFANESNVGTLFFRFLYDFWLVLLFAILLLSFLVYANNKIQVGKANIIKNWHYISINTLLFFIVSALTIGGLRGGYDFKVRPLDLIDASKYVNTPMERAIVLNTPFSLFLSSSKKSLKKLNYYTKEELSSIYTALHKADTVNDFTNKNVVVFILESFGSEHIGALNKDIENYKGFTPFLDSLIAHSYTFKYSYANGRKSVGAIPSLIASIPSLVKPHVLSQYSGNRLNSLANTLSSKEYYTAFFHGAPNGSMSFDAFTAHVGFDNYYGKDQYANDKDFDGYWGIWDEEFFQFFANEMNEFKEPFFTSLFSLSSHHPYGIPKRYEGKFPEGELELQRTIGYTDYALKRFFEKAAKMPWFKNTLFVLTADHAATYSNLPEYKTLTGYFAVPIIIYEPGTDNWKGFNDSTIVQQIDIMPTVLNYLKYDKDYIAFGTDMTDDEKDHFSVSYLVDAYQVVMGDFLLQFNGTEVICLYNIKKDRLQKVNLKGQFPKIEQKILRNLKAFIQEYNSRMIDNSCFAE